MLEGHSDRVWCVSWSRDGELLASSSGDKQIRIWGKNNEGNFECKSILDGGHTRTIRSLDWSPDGQFLASASFDGTTAIWLKRTSDFEQVCTLEGHENEVKSAVWSHDGQYLATCSRDKTIWVWETNEDMDYDCSGVLQGHTQDVKHLAWHPK